MSEPSHHSPSVSNATESKDHLDQSLAAIRAALDGLRFGSVQITIHDGRVVQIDVTEKRRLTHL